MSTATHSDITATAGDTVILPCISSVRDRPVQWRYQRSEGSRELYIYYDDVVDKMFSSKISDTSMNKADGIYSLTLQNINGSDSGYTCVLKTMVWEPDMLSC